MYLQQEREQNVHSLKYKPGIRSDAKMETWTLEAAFFKCSCRKAAPLISSNDFWKKGAAYLQVFTVLVVFLFCKFINLQKKELHQYFPRTDLMLVQ